MLIESSVSDAGMIGIAEQAVHTIGAKYRPRNYLCYESGMISTRVDHEGSCKLVNVSEPLDRWGVNKLPLAGSQSDESMNSVSDYAGIRCGLEPYSSIPPLHARNDTDDTSNTKPQQVHPTKTFALIDSVLHGIFKL